MYADVTYWHANTSTRSTLHVLLVSLISFVYIHVHISVYDNSRTSDVFRSILLSVRSILRMCGKNVQTAFYVTGNSGKAPVQTVKFTNSVKKWVLDSEKFLPMDAKTAINASNHAVFKTLYLLDCAIE